MNRTFRLSIEYIKKMYHIKDIEPITNVSRKQLSNRIKSLQKDYPKLIIGGGKGKGGKYKIHPLMVPFLIVPNKEKELTNTEKQDLINKQNSFLEKMPDCNNFETFSKIDWDWFVCFRPVNATDIKELIQMIPLSSDTDLAFYSIHRQVDKLHIHFVLKSKMHRNEVLKEISIKSNNECVLFDPFYSKGCYSYFTDSYMFRNGEQKLSGYGYYNSKIKIN
jgi:hypothetical protein